MLNKIISFHITETRWHICKEEHLTERSRSPFPHPLSDYPAPQPWVNQTFTTLSIHLPAQEADSCYNCWLVRGFDKLKKYSRLIVKKQALNKWVCYIKTDRASWYKWGCFVVFLQSISAVWTQMAVKIFENPAQVNTSFGFTRVDEFDWGGKKSSVYCSTLSVWLCGWQKDASAW